MAEWVRSGIAPGKARFEPTPAVDRIATVSGSVSPTTERQIRHALANGFDGIALDARDMIGEDSRGGARQGRGCRARQPEGGPQRHPLHRARLVGRPRRRDRQACRRPPPYRPQPRAHPQPAGGGAIAEARRHCRWRHVEPRARATRRRRADGAHALPAVARIAALRRSQPGGRRSTGWRSRSRADRSAPTPISPISATVSPAASCRTGARPPAKVHLISDLFGSAPLAVSAAIGGRLGRQGFFWQDLRQASCILLTVQVYRSYK